jgi:two-component system, chemotaxis family, protein-glutamate methylesterase/glutaminase
MPREHATTHAQTPLWLVAITASAGGIQALRTILAYLPADLPAAVVIVQHRSPTVVSALERILARVSRLPVQSALTDDVILPGRVYVARPDLHLTVQNDRRFRYVDGTRVRGLRSSGNPLLDSAARVFGRHTIAVVLTGGGTDATDGVQAVKAAGGIVLVQDPVTAEHYSMPLSALKTGAVDHALPLEALAPAIAAIAEGRPQQSHA